MDDYNRSMVKNTAVDDSTRTRIVEAATLQFAALGIAGARVERIAKEAATSKERVYAYFRSKEELYAHVMEHELALIMDATSLDARDMPGYAGQLFDYFRKNPNHFRLLGWGRMEAASPIQLDEASRARIQRKLDQIKLAQAEGHMEATWDPVDVLALVNQIAVTYFNQIEISAMHAPNKASLQRAAVLDAVRRVFPPKS